MRRLDFVGRIAVAFLSVSVSDAWAVAAHSRPRVEVRYAEPASSDFRKIHDVVRSKRVLERMAGLLGRFRLPARLTLTLTQCGETNSWYEPRDRTVTVCYEYLQAILDRAPAKTSPEGVTRHEALVGPLAQVLLHESAHALFDLLRVPIFGREEDAADQLSAFTILLPEPKQSREFIDGTASFFGAFAKEEKPDRDAFADVHGLWPQRFYDLVCLAYGLDDKAFGYLVERGSLPKDRAEGCGAEYDQVAFAVGKLIAPSMVDRSRGRDQARRRALRR